MNRWATRLRRTASVLLGVHLLQVLLLAASAACDLAAAERRPAGARLVAAVVIGNGHASHHETAHHSAPATPAGHADESLQGSQHESHHDSHTTNCPMAMACAATAVVAPVQRLSATEVHVASARTAYEPRALRSRPHTPEPPPPRG